MRRPHRSTDSEERMLLLGRMASWQVKHKTSVRSLSEVEFKVFSQFGDDGIIQWLVHALHIDNKTFVEFGVEDYEEANTRFLMMNDNWSGLVLDASKSSIASIVGASYYWRHELQARCAFIDRENINDLIRASGLLGEIGLLHIDLDGNDYWIWNAIDCVSPILVILEYNSVFGFERALTVPYDKSFVRTRAHSSNLYFGASLPALAELSAHRGYAFLGCNTAGNNAYFVRRDKLNASVRETSLAESAVHSKFRESRDPEGRLSFVSGSARAHVIRGMPVYNTRSNKVESL
jgi:hypothetical protein